MALIVLDDNCSLCGKGFAEAENAFLPWGSFPAGRLGEYCHRPMHWACYLGWDRQAEFAGHALNAWRQHTAESPGFHRVLDRGAVHVSIWRPHKGHGEVVLFLHRLGADVRVALEDWDDWIRFPPQGLPPPLAEQIAAVRDQVRAALPSHAMILGNYPALPDGHSEELDPAADQAVYSQTIRDERWRELMLLARDGLENSYFRRLIEFVGYYPRDEEAAERLRDGRPWIDKFLFESRPLTAQKEAGLLWVLLGGWPAPTVVEVRNAAADYLRRVIAEFPDTRAAGHAIRLAARWGLGDFRSA